MKRFVKAWLVSFGFTSGEYWLGREERPVCPLFGDASDCRAGRFEAEQRTDDITDFLNEFIKGSANRGASGALKAARENENRWMKSPPSFSTDPDRMEQMSSTAKLRRLEVERIEALLAGAAEPCGWRNPVRSEMVEANNRMGETA